MAVWCMAALALLFYTAAIPLKLVLVVRIAARSGFGLGLAPFENRFALRSAIQRAAGKKKRLLKKRAAADIEKAARLPAAWKALVYLLGHARLEHLEAQGRVATGDAAHTALICGCAGALEGTLEPFVPPGTLKLSLKPDFSMEESDIQLCGMVSIRLGHIICAALIGAWNYIARRIRHGKASD